MHKRVTWRISVTAYFAGAIFSACGILYAIFAYKEQGTASYSLLNHFVSELGWNRSSKAAWAFNYGVLAGALMTIPLFYSLGEAMETWLGRLSAWVGIASCVACSMVGFFPLERLVPHLVFAGIFFLTIMLCVFGVTLSFIIGNKMGKPFPMIFAGGVVVAISLLFIVYPKDSLMLALKHPDSFNRPTLWILPITEWLLVVSLQLWLTTASYYVWQRSYGKDS